MTIKLPQRARVAEEELREQQSGFPTCQLLSRPLPMTPSIQFPAITPKLLVLLLLLLRAVPTSSVPLCLALFLHASKKERRRRRKARAKVKLVGAGKEDDDVILLLVVVPSSTVEYGYLHHFGPSKFDVKIRLMQISV